MAVFIKPRPMLRNVTITGSNVGMMVTGGTITGENIVLKNNQTALLTEGDAVVEFDGLTIR